MARRLTPRREAIPPSLTPSHAIELLRQQLDRLEEIKNLPSGHPEARKWMMTTEKIVDAAFGKPNGERHENTSQFMRWYGPLVMNMPHHAYEESYRETLRQRKAVLESCIEQLEILAPPAAQVASERYQFHSEIERVSGVLYRDGHYKQAALEAYIRVIEEVKRKSRLQLDGDNLMNQAFGCDNRTPAIQLNALMSDEERDEQRGFMFLYKGVVGLRNSKAHTNRLFNDLRRAHEYLALASLLIRILE